MPENDRSGLMGMNDTEGELLKDDIHGLRQNAAVILDDEEAGPAN